jgi:hypothetical protein
MILFARRRAGRPRGEGEGGGEVREKDEEGKKKTWRTTSLGILATE